MGILTNLIDDIVEASLSRVRSRTRDRNRHDGLAVVNEVQQPIRTTTPSRTFTVKRGMNGDYIEFARHRWNPSGPDEYESCIYIVREGESVIDAIAAVLVLMNKEGD